MNYFILLLFSFTFSEANFTTLPIDQTYTLTSWNIYKGANQGLYNDLDRILVESDFVNIQEILMTQEQTLQMDKFDNYSWAFAESFKDDGFPTGVASAAKWTPIETIRLKSPNSQPITFTPKMSVITKFKLSNGQELWIANTHALNFNIDNEAYRRQIDAVIDVLRHHKGPLLYTGDFNTWYPGRWEHLISRAKELGMTYLELDSPSGFFSLTMDHIFYRNIKDVKGEVLTNFVSSDHYPLRVSFKL